MAAELAPDNIRVNVINPVAGETAMLRDFMGEDTPEMRAQVRRVDPAGPAVAAVRHRDGGGVLRLRRGGVHHRRVPRGRRRALRLIGPRGAAGPAGLKPDPQHRALSSGSAFRPTDRVACLERRRAEARPRSVAHFRGVGLKPDPRPRALSCGSAFRPTDWVAMIERRRAEARPTGDSEVGLKPEPQPRALSCGSAFRPTDWVACLERRRAEARPTGDSEASG